MYKYYLLVTVSIFFVKPGSKSNEVAVCPTGEYAQKQWQYVQKEKKILSRLSKVYRKIVCSTTWFTLYILHIYLAK
mgnify:CR=1 FL=1